MKENTHTFLSKLNKPQLGSLGEFLFCQIMKCKEFSIKSRHKNQIDFVINEIIKVDVKTQRKLNENYYKTPKYYGRKLKGVEYALVILYNDKLYFSLKDIVEEYLYEDIQGWIEKWKVKRTIKLEKSINRGQKNAINLVKKKIIDKVKGFGKVARIIYRTNQIDFGDESPGNLIPLKIEKERWTIFLNYKYEISDEKLIEIIAFKEEEATQFPRLKKNRLHEEKIDLKRLDEKYKFKTVKNLLETIKNS